LEKKWIQFIRSKYDIPEATTDDEICKLETSLGNLPHVFDPIRVANWIELLELRKIFFPGKPQLGVFTSGYDNSWQGCSERLFLEGYYGPSCIWSRAALELLLQEICLSDKKVDREFKDQIRRPGRNPSIEKCVRKLGDSLSKSDTIACRTIAKNGDAVVHHRLDIITKGKSIEDILRGWGVAEKNINKPGIKANERLLLMGHRLSKERGMAKSSLEQLYGILSRHSPRETI